MNSPLDLILDKSSFLHWAEGREGHFELKGNRVVVMAGGTRGHARIVSNIAYSLSLQLDREAWSVTTADLAVEIGEDVRYPDVMVEPADGPSRALSTINPIFLAEVLSPSSLALDLHEKAAEYLSLGTLEAYLVAAQDEMRVWLWQRAAGEKGGRSFPARPQEISGAEGKLALNALGVEIGLATIYHGLVKAS
jgi:Uma2 family endonuclease